MTALEEFDKFYTAELFPAMDKLKEKCSSADGWGYASLFSFLLFAGFGIVALAKNGLHFAGIISIITGIMGVVSVYFYTKRNDTFNDDYKQLVIKKIIDHVVPGTSYKPDFCISQKEYKVSGLFRTRYDDYFGDDFMEGIYKNISFRCSGLETKYENNSTIFKGFFFNARLSNLFSGGTYIWDRDFEQLPASMMDDYRMMSLPNVVRIPISGNNFNQYFSVFSTTTYEAVSLLSAERIKQMVNLRQKLNASMAISFVAGHCYVAIGIKEDLLDPGSYSPEDKEQVMKSYVTISLIPEIINGLSLTELIN